jgi:hypothetical protein
MEMISCGLPIWCKTRRMLGERNRRFERGVLFVRKREAEDAEQ